MEADKERITYFEYKIRNAVCSSPDSGQAPDQEKSLGSEAGGISCLDYRLYCY